MKKRVKIQVSIAGSGDPSQTELERKYASLRRTLEEHSRAARLMNKTGRTAEEIESTVAAERRKDAAIPRVSGFTAPFSFKPGEEIIIDAELADKWEAAGICSILPAEKKTAA